MALYELQDAKLGDLEGQGYAFPVDTFQGKAYRGVFFSNDKDAVTALAEGDDSVTFEGIVYHKTTSGQDSLTVDIEKVVSVGVGTRADFKVV